MSAVMLKCNICPRKPNFSDVSHLLTHVSSKGHLSHYFKLQVRSHQEPEARDLLAAYDEWYNEFNLAGLLSDRMIAKEGRKSKGSATARHGSSSRKPSARHVVQAPIRNDQVPDFMDPRLSQSYHPSMNTQDPLPSQAPAGAVQLSFDPCVQLWPVGNKQRVQRTRASGSRNFKTESPDSDDASSPILQRKRSLRQVTNLIQNSAPIQNLRPVTPDPFVDDESFEYEEEDGSEAREEMTRLKGVLWPGMDIFDSATEQMRKKRNQKKDGTILKQMEKTSENVEATELVFSPSGTLRKARHISGMVDDSSPLKGETPIPKKRAVRPRRPLLAQSNSNVNLLRGRRMQEIKHRKRSEAVRLERLSQQTLPLLDSPQEGPLATGFGNSFEWHDEDFKLALETLDTKPSRGLSVYNDGNNRDNSAYSNNGRSRTSRFATFGAPGSFALNDQSTDISNRRSLAAKSPTVTRSATVPKYPRGKENIEPILTDTGRIDSQFGGGNWNVQHLAGENQYASRFFSGAGFQNYASFDEKDAFGYSYNPLAFSLAELEHNGDQKEDATYGLFSGLGNEASKSVRAVSPDGTVSDPGRDDMAHLYFEDLPA